MSSIEKVKEPFENKDEFVTENGNRIEVGEEYKILSSPCGDRYNAKLVSIYWNPRGLKNGKYSRSDGHVCILNAEFVFDTDENDYLDGRHKSVESYNIDFIVFGESNLD